MTTSDWLAAGERRSQWGLAYIRVRWRNEVGPLARKATTDGPTDPELCDQLAVRLEGLARAARHVAELAREENA